MKKDVHLHFQRKSLKGFALAEVMIAIFFITMAIVLVGALSTQVMNLQKSSKQSSTVIEMRNKANALLKNTVPWLSKMRVDPVVGTLYSGCIPDSSSTPLGFTCPAVDDNLFASDTGLQTLASCQPNSTDYKNSCALHPYSTPIVDNFGQKIAGSVDDPMYLDNDGTPCKLANPATSCPMISTGYFMRGNEAIDQSPGSVRFIVKISQNQSAIKQRAGVSPMKPQYMSMDVGTDWSQSSGSCPVGTVKIGFLTNGAPSCINPTASCGTGLVSVGINIDGTPNCKSLPNCPTGQSAVLDATTNALACAGGTPCGDNQLFLGYTAGSGAPMCSSPDVTCKTGEVQTGLSVVAGKLTAQCAQLPSCNDSQKLSYDGSKFVCQSAAVVSSCASDEFVSGLDDNGKVICGKRTIASDVQACDPGFVVYGLDATGKIMCRADQGSGGSTETTTAAPASALTYYESPEYALGELGNTSAQGLLDVPNPYPGKIPVVVNWFLVDKVPQFGYEVGDEVPVDHMIAWSGYIATMWNTSIFRIIKRNEWYIWGKGPANGGYNYPRDPNWKIKFRMIVADAGSGGTTPNTQPAATTQVCYGGNCFYMDNDSSAATNFDGAITACRARNMALCSHEQWVGACYAEPSTIHGVKYKNNNVSTSFEKEWVFATAYSGEVTVAHNTDLSSATPCLATYNYAFSASMKYRCCMSK